MKEDNASVIKDTYSKFIEPRLVDLQSGDYVQASAEEINKFEPKDAVKDPAKAKQSQLRQIKRESRFVQIKHVFIL